VLSSSREVSMKRDAFATARMNTWIVTLVVLGLGPLAPRSCTPGNPGEGEGDAGVCGVVPSCTATDLSQCPPRHGCLEGQCYAPYVGAIECTCDAQCPTERPFCRGTACNSCRSDADCPSSAPCCAGIPETSGRTSCFPRGTFPEPRCQFAGW
jgi:hypothetical protein